MTVGPRDKIMKLYYVAAAWIQPCTIVIRLQLSINVEEIS
jgi:hypothetical protein